MQNIVQDSFVVISDIHSNDQAVDKIERFYLNEYDKIFVLGDITGRGRGMSGWQSFYVLNYFYNLTKKYPDRIVYVPGNHDQLLYGYHRGKVDSKMLTHNGESETLWQYENRYKEFGEEGAKKIEEMLDWIAEQPIQAIHEFDGQKYVLAHALFNQKLYDYNPKLCLKDYYDYKEKGINESICSQMFDTLWFRKARNSYDPNILPTNGEVMVIGHTMLKDREGQNLDLENANGDIVKVHCVDGGAGYFLGMLKYDGKEDVMTTKLLVNSSEIDAGMIAEHVDTSPKPEPEKEEEIFSSVPGQMFAVSFNYPEQKKVDSDTPQKVFDEESIPSENICINLVHDFNGGYDNYFIYLEDAKKIGLTPIILPYLNYYPITDAELEKVKERYTCIITHLDMPKEPVKVYCTEDDGAISYYVVDYVIATVRMKDRIVPWGNPVGKYIEITEEEYKLLDRYYSVYLVPKFGVPETGFKM